MCPLTWKTFAQFFNGSWHFLLTDALIFLSFCCCFQSLPGKRASKKVHEYITQWLHIITTALFWNTAIHKYWHCFLTKTWYLLDNNTQSKKNIWKTEFFKIVIAVILNIPIPKCVLMLAYLAVPVRFLFSRYAMCWCVRASRYFFANPKSMIYTRLPFLPSPIKKLSGLTSRWIKFLEWMYSMRLIWKKIPETYATSIFWQMTWKSKHPDKHAVIQSN